MIKYCRRCDLAFCERHEQEHTSLVGDQHGTVFEGDPLPVAAHGFVPCCICTGILRPSAKVET